MNVLVACEESQRVCTAFREKGHNAFSCDILPCSGGHPEWHIQVDVLEILNPKEQPQAAGTWHGGYERYSASGIMFSTCDRKPHWIEKWDLIIAHPPCTYLTNAGTRQYSFKMNPPEKVYARMALREEAADFFMQFVNADCDRICIENPVGYMNSKYRKPDQTVQPYWFAKDENDEENYQLKRTCFWLKNLEPLPCNKNMKHPDPMYICEGEKCKGKKIYWCEGSKGNKGGQAARAKARSKTFPAIAKAMADTWG
jgi:hypothetical protein